MCAQILVSGSASKEPDVKQISMPSQQKDLPHQGPHLILGFTLLGRGMVILTGRSGETTVHILFPVPEQNQSRWLDSGLNQVTVEEVAGLHCPH